MLKPNDWPYQPRRFLHCHFCSVHPRNRSFRRVVLFGYILRYTYRPNVSFSSGEIRELRLYRYSNRKGQSDIEGYSRRSGRLVRLAERGILIKLDTLLSYWVSDRSFLHLSTSTLSQFTYFCYNITPTVLCFSGLNGVY